MDFKSPFPNNPLRGRENTSTMNFTLSKRSSAPIPPLDYLFYMNLQSIAYAEFFNTQLMNRYKLDTKL